jgi:hypothetical protein
MATLSVAEIQSSLRALTFLNDAPISVLRLNCCPKSKNAPTASAPILGLVREHSTKSAHIVPFPTARTRGRGIGSSKVVSNHDSSRPITTSRAQMMIGDSRHSCSLKHRPDETYLLDYSQFGHGHSSIHLDVARVGGC